jgi:hypothetical protein
LANQTNQSKTFTEFANLLLVWSLQKLSLHYKMVR